MIRTWMADITPLMEPETYKFYYKQLPDFRKEKADRIRIQSEKARSAGAWILFQKIREKYNISESVAFNLSHSGDYVLCSVNFGDNKEEKVGCDIEEIKDPNMKIAARFFCRAEYQHIAGQKTEAMRGETFYRYWVLKESFMKATRLGMALDMKSFEIQLSTPPKLIRKPEEFPEEYYYQEYGIPGIPYKIAVCSTSQEIERRINREFVI